jgi:hypothetical protein
MGDEVQGCGIPRFSHHLYRCRRWHISGSGCTLPERNIGISGCPLRSKVCISSHGALVASVILMELAGLSGAFYQVHGIRNCGCLVCQSAPKRRNELYATTREPHLWHPWLNLGVWRRMLGALAPCTASSRLRAMTPSVHLGLQWP